MKVTQSSALLFKKTRAVVQIPHMWLPYLTHSASPSCSWCLLLGSILACTMRALYIPGSTEVCTDSNNIKMSSALK